MSETRSLRCAVVLQTPADPQSAVYMSYQSLAAELERLGHSMEIVSPADFPALRNVSGRWVPLTYPFAIASWMRRRHRDFDLVMFQSYAGWLATTLNRRERPHSFVMFHGVEPLYHRELREEAKAGGQPLSWRYRLLQEGLMPFMLGIACRRADAIGCLNRAEAQFLAAKRWTPSRGARVLAHGVPPECFAPLRTDHAVRTLLFLGQWLPMKGIRYLREAAITLLREDPVMRLTCAGTLAPAVTVLAGFPRDIHDRITVLPRVDQAGLAPLYRDADAFVFPSLYEGFSLAILEAMAARLPIVTTGVGVAADALRHEQSALLVPKRSAAAIVSAVRRLQSDPDLAARLGAAAADAAEPYRLENVVRQTVDIIMEEAGAIS